ncbi:hypothetical protein FOMG_17168 [Fusarium oxysporum f. sp. melonis 26406]|uniref:Uncharacterized protein n=1 Tax=Fusarium oxysporum f. sp. melonis 26406 TaxID=1089452 RepID=W9ZYV1_FUSOX|nr:hypothetical protein FOMG_17168 [Fusarium oxysporum f. sp. melonis 26406]
MVVEKGDKIFIPADKLTATEVKVEWQTNLKKYSEQYYSVPFINKDKANEESVIFIQKSYLDALKSKKVSGDDFTVVIDDAFQYGQNKEKTRRWLAFHNKKNEAYQWRFVESLTSKLGQGIVNFASGFFPQIDLGLLKGLFGDYLHNF